MSLCFNLDMNLVAIWQSHYGVSSAVHRQWPSFATPLESYKQHTYDDTSVLPMPYEHEILSHCFIPSKSSIACTSLPHLDNRFGYSVGLESAAFEKINPMPLHVVQENNHVS